MWPNALAIMFKQEEPSEDGSKRPWTTEGCRLREMRMPTLRGGPPVAMATMKFMATFRQEAEESLTLLAAGETVWLKR